MKLCIVTATTDPTRAERCLASWGDVPLIIVLNGAKGQHGAATGTAYSKATVLYESGGYLGSVPAFRLGVDHALANTDADIIANFHDDLELLDPEWTTRVIRHFERHPACGLAGFGGAVGLGDADIYQKPYQPMQLARIGFRSNLVDAEVHGARSLLVERVACLDGFSQVGRREFWEGRYNGAKAPRERPWTLLEKLGFVHHFQDSALGCIAKRYGWETWYLPIRARHYGGATAVGDPGYQAWAQSIINGGDHGFWQKSHLAGYEEFRDVLPIRV